MLKQLISDLNSLKDDEKTKILQGFFKTGKGQYGEGDIFLGISVPQQREIAKKYYDLEFYDLQKLLDSEIHEMRLTGLIILVKKFEKSKNRKKEFDFYLKNTSRINNWDLVDVTAPKIVGIYLNDKDRKVLYKLAKSKSLWERRIAIVSCFEFIRRNDFDDALNVSEILLGDKEDLIQKAVGWMLREVGKRDINVLEKFLRKNYKLMPRTMLRYAIEKFDEEKRKKYLRGEYD